MSFPPISRRGFLRLLTGSALAWSTLQWTSGARAYAFGEADLLRLALLDDGSPGARLREGALGPLLLEVDQTTSIAVARRGETLSLASGEFQAFPLIFFTGDQGFPAWPDNQRARLRRYLQAGGMVVFDSSEGRVDGSFRQSVERELEAILPEHTLQRTPSSHVLYKSFYLCRGDEGRVRTADYTESIDIEGRMQVLYLHNDLLGAYVRTPSGGDMLAVSGGDRGRDFAYRMGVNLVMYALCLDYKEDQVHVPFILRRRRWSVP